MLKHITLIVSMYLAVVQCLPLGDVEIVYYINPDCSIRVFHYVTPDRLETMKKLVTQCAFVFQHA